MATRYVIPARRCHHQGPTFPKVKRPSTTQCGRCGETRNPHHMCKALSRVCYACRKYGHYAQLCPFIPTSRSTTAACNYVHAPAAKQHKTSKQQQRDKQRFNHFVQRKSLCMEMPYAEVNNEELQKCFPKYPCSNVQQVSESKVIKLENDCVMYAEQIQGLTDKTKSLQEVIVEEQKRHGKTAADLKDAEREVLSITSQIEDQNSDVHRLKEENKELQSNVRSLEHKLKANVTELQNLRATCGTLRQDKQKLHTSVTELSNNKAQLQRENQKIQSTLNKVSDTRAKIKWENKQQRQEIDNKIRDINELKDTQGNYFREIIELQETVHRQQQEITALEYTRDDYFRELIELQDTVHHQLQEITELKEQPPRLGYMYA